MTARRLTLTLVVFLVVSAAASPLLSILQAGLKVDPELLRFETFATAVGAAVVWLAFPAARQVPEVTRTGTGRALVLALLLAVALTVVLGLLSVGQGRPWPALDPHTLPAPLGVVLAVQVLGAAGEEVGWRGVVQPLLERRLPVAAAGVVTGLFFGLGHFYVAAAGAAVYAVFVLSAVALSVTLAVLTTGRSLTARVVVATCFHWAVNTALLLGFSDGDESLAWIASTTVAAGVVAALALLLRRGGRTRP